VGCAGKVYRLRTPSKRYLSTLSEYDSSNPTKDWGFPLLSLHSLSLLSPATTAFGPSNVDLYSKSSQVVAFHLSHAIFLFSFSFFFVGYYNNDHNSENARRAEIVM
jgi:hypothetical protein